MAKKGRETTPRGRDAGSGKFIPVDEAKKHPNTSVVEKVPLPSKKKK